MLDQAGLRERPIAGSAVAALICCAQYIGALPVGGKKLALRSISPRGHPWRSTLVLPMLQIVLAGQVVEGVPCRGGPGL
jgi:hypothetical protein